MSREINPCTLCGTAAEFGNTNYRPHPFSKTGQHTNGVSAIVVGCPKCIDYVHEKDATEWMPSRLKRTEWVVSMWNARHPLPETEGMG